MKMIPTLATLVAFTSLAISAETKTEKKVNISEFTLGKTISGTEITTETVTGHPVVIDYWGVNCGPCLAHIPFFNSVAKRYDNKGLVLIGAHCQSASDEEVLKVAKANKIKFPITTGTNGPIEFSGIPHTAVFAADGTMLFHGHPDDKEFERALKTATKDVGNVAAGAAASPSAPAKPVAAGPIVPSRPWTNAEGKPVVAALISVKDGMGTFRKGDGNTFNYAVNKLSAADQELISKAQTTKN